MRLLICFLSVFILSGCANSKLQELRKAESEQSKSMIQVYDRAVRFCQEQLIVKEQSLIQSQMESYLIINMLCKKYNLGNEDLNKIKSENILTYAEVTDHYLKFDQAKKDAKKRIDEGFQDFYNKIGAEQSKLDHLT